MVNYVHDIDLTEDVGIYDFTIIPTTCYWNFPNGFGKKIMNLYPYITLFDRETKYADTTKLGEIVETSYENEPSFILMYVIKGYNYKPSLNNDYFEYESFEKALNVINILYKGKRIAIPFLGHHKFDGNGDKERIREILERCSSNIELYVYDYKQITTTVQRTINFINRGKILRNIDQGIFADIMKDYKKSTEELREKKKEFNCFKTVGNDVISKKYNRVIQPQREGKKKKGGRKKQK